ncbi:hypothetical protein QZH41_015359, partial [Actinostola sp. cb2023]
TLCRYRANWNLDLQFRPFFISGVMNLSGNRPPGVVPAKMVYMTKDIARLSEFYGIPINLPSVRSLPAMRLLTATTLSHPDKTEHLSRELWMRIWSRDEDIVLPESLKMACFATGLNETQTAALVSRIADKDVKDSLKDNTNKALEAG